MPEGDRPTSTPIASKAAEAAYRDIKAAGSVPLAVARCWRAIAVRMPEVGCAEITYREIATRSRVARFTAIRAVEFGVYLGCIERDRGRLARYPGDAWNRPNRYRWAGKPSQPVKRGDYRAFLMRLGGHKCDPVGVVTKVTRRLG